MDLATFWFCVIAVLWAGYFLLEGFDFGVGMLLPFLPRNERERGVMFDSIGPVWDGNEVWLVVAGGATFAAFPAWYATLFSGFYVALLAILVLLIIRVVSFEWRGKAEDRRWRAAWTAANVAGSVGAPLLWGVAFANLVNGVPINGSGDFAGSFADLFSPFTVFAGLATVLLFAFHGATFLTLRTTGGLCERAAGTARRLAIPSAAAASVLMAWTVVVATDRNHRDVFPPVLPAVLGIAALVAACACVQLGRRGWAFVMTALATVLLVATTFTSLYPRVMVSDPVFANSLTVANSSADHYTLAVITVVAVIVTPLMLLYQGWTYYVFRARLTGEGGETAPPGESAPG